MARQEKLLHVSLQREKERCEGKRGKRKKGRRKKLSRAGVKVKGMERGKVLGYSWGSPAVAHSVYKARRRGREERVS